MSRVRETLTELALLASAAGLAHLPGTVTIVCRNPGMRRNGERHSAVETYPIERWSEDELIAFEADPAFDVRFELESRSAPGADTADAVQDQGAGAPTPDLGAKPDGTGPSAPVARPGEPVVPAVLDESRLAAIRGRLDDLRSIFVAHDRKDRDAGDAYDYGQVPEEGWLELEAVLGFRPVPAELEAALRFDPPVVTPVEGTDAAAPAGGVPPVVETVTPPDTVTPVDRIAAIRAVLPTLEKPRDFTRDDKPRIEVVEKLVKFPVSRAEIEAAQAPEPETPAA